MRDKKGVLGLPTVMAVFILFLVIAVLAVTIIITMVSLRDVAEGIDVVAGTTANESIEPSTSGTDLDPSTQVRRNRQCTITTVLNGTGIIINSANFTETACIITNTTGEFVTVAWNITYDFQYSSASVSNIETNITAGVTEFFENTSTVYSILIVIVIILAIAIIIAVVTTFGGGAAGTRRREGAGRSRGEGTLMDI